MFVQSWLSLKLYFIIVKVAHFQESALYRHTHPTAASDRHQIMIEAKSNQLRNLAKRREGDMLRIFQSGRKEGRKEKLPRSGVSR